ncbi:MAG TPA: hypothetical protein VHE30_12795 [Polyangiaceae bacterium]|nr:hypothetical protein [Polyangiaceae bacterium]
MKPWTRHVALVAAVGSVLLLGCGGKSDDPKPGRTVSGSDAGPGKQNGETCVLNSDCADPLSCVFGKCHAQCVEARDCPANARCIQSNGAGVCVLETDTGCTYNADCPSSLSCAPDGLCRNQCQSDRDCLVNEGCSVDHLCVSK